MATRRAATNAAVQTLSDMQDNTVAALIPVNSKGETVQVDGDNWHMPTGSDLATLNDEDEVAPEEAPQTPADRVISMLAEVENDERAYVKVSRVLQGKPSWCDDYSAATFEAGGYKMIREQWGPGEYQVILYGTIPGTKRFTIRTRATVQIEAPLKSAVPVAPQSELGTLVQQLAANQQEMMRVLTERPASPDPMLQMTGMLSMMKLMREAMGIGGETKPQNGLKDIVEAIKQLREVSEEINPSAVPDTPMAMVSKMLPLIQAGLQQRQLPAPVAPIAAPAPAPVALAAPPVSIAPVSAPPQPNDKPPMNIAEQKGYLATLVAMSKAKMPTSEAAEFIYQKLHDDLIEALHRDDWFELLSNIMGDLSAEKEWLTTTRNEALALFGEPEEDGVDGAVKALTNLPTSAG